MEIKYPQCGISHYVKAGLTAQEKQRYKCLDCGRKFTAFSKTIFHGQKLAEGKLRTLFALLLRDATIEDMVELLGVSSKTAYMWRMKVYKCLENYQKDIILSGNI